MICIACRGIPQPDSPPLFDIKIQTHGLCRELRRQNDAALTATERAGGSWCDCQHKLPRRPSTGAMQAPTLVK